MWGTEVKERRVNNLYVVRIRIHFKEVEQQFRSPESQEERKL